MAVTALEYVVDEAPASAAVFAALAGILARRPDREPPALSVALRAPLEPALNRLARACARRGLAVELGAKAITLAGREIPLVPEGQAPPGTQVRLREGRVALALAGAGPLAGRAVAQLGEPCELLAASPLLDLLERGAGLRWAVLSCIEGRDDWQASVDLSEREASFKASFEAALRRSFPALVGRVAFGSALGPQLGAALHLNVVLGPGASVDGLHDQLSQLGQVGGARAGASAWPRLQARRGVSSADSLGAPGQLLLDLDAMVGVGPLIRLVAYYDPPAMLAADLLRRLG